MYSVLESLLHLPFFNFFSLAKWLVPPRRPAATSSTYLYSINMYVCKYVYVFLFYILYVYIHTYIHAYIYIYIYICMYACMYVV